MVYHDNGDVTVNLKVIFTHDNGHIFESRESILVKVGDHATASAISPAFYDGGVVEHWTNYPTEEEEVVEELPSGETEEEV